MKFIKQIKTLFLLAFCFSSYCLSGEEKKEQSLYKVVGYYTNWSMYRTPSFKPHNINPQLVTHINYAFAKVDIEGNIILIDPWADIDYRSSWTNNEPYHGNFRELYELKKQNPHLKTLISLGGWTLSEPFSQLAENPEARKKLAKNIIEFCKTYNFDGVDIDWEYPCFGNHMGRGQDKENFTLLLEEIYNTAKTSSPSILVTIAAPAGPWHYQNIEVEKIHHYVDWINLMTYDFHGPWKDMDNHITNHQAALFSTKKGDPRLNVYSAVTYYLEKGTPKEKIVVGIPLYGRSYSGANGLYKSYNEPGRGTTAEKGVVFFSDIKKNLSSSYQYAWDENAQASYLYNEHEFISFDDEVAISGKCNFIKNFELGGVMVWELGFDVMPSWDALKTINRSLNK